MLNLIQQLFEQQHNNDLTGFKTTHTEICLRQIRHINIVMAAFIGHKDGHMSLSLINDNDLDDKSQKKSYTDDRPELVVKEKTDKGFKLKIPNDIVCKWMSECIIDYIKNHVKIHSIQNQVSLVFDINIVGAYEPNNATTSLVQCNINNYFNNLNTMNVSDVCIGKSYQHRRTPFSSLSCVVTKVFNDSMIDAFIKKNNLWWEYAIDSVCAQYKRSDIMLRQCKINGLHALDAYYASRIQRMVNTVVANNSTKGSAEQRLGLLDTRILRLEHQVEELSKENFIIKQNALSTTSTLQQQIQTLIQDKEIMSDEISTLKEQVVTLEECKLAIEELYSENKMLLKLLKQHNIQIVEPTTQVIEQPKIEEVVTIDEHQVVQKQPETQVFEQKIEYVDGLPKPVKEAMENNESVLTKLRNNPNKKVER